MAETISIKDLSFLNNRFTINDELAAYISVRKPQEQAAFEIKMRYLTVKDKMLEELMRLIRIEEEKYAADLQKKIQTLEQAAEKGIELFGTFQCGALPNVGRKIVFKYTKNEMIDSHDIYRILASQSNELRNWYSRFYENVYHDIEQVNSLQQGWEEVKELSGQRSGPVYSGYGYGIRGTVTAAAEAAVANMGMSILQGFSDGLAASSDASMVKQSAAQSLARAKRELLIMGQEQAKKMVGICLDYLFKDMEDEIDTLGITPYQTFDSEEQAAIDLRNENYDEAFAEEDITPTCYADHVFRALNENPYNQNQYCHLAQAAYVLEDPAAAEHILDFAEELGIGQSVKQMMEAESMEKLPQIKKMPEHTLRQTEQKFLAVARVYSRAVEPEINRLKERIEYLKRLPQVREKITRYKGLIAAGWITLFITPDHRVVAVGKNRDRCLDTECMKDAVAVAVGGDDSMALRNDGTVAFSPNWYSDIDTYKRNCCDIVSVSAGISHCTVLKRNGTILTFGHDIGHGSSFLKTEDWYNIVAVASGAFCTYGLKADGTVVASGVFSARGRIRPKMVVSSWTDIVAISAGDDHVLGLKRDGTVLAGGTGGYTDKGQCKVASWWGIVAIAAGNDHSIGLRADGTVVACGRNTHRECEVGDWRDIVAIAAGSVHTVGLKADGTMVATGENEDGRCNLSQYRLCLE